MALTGAIKSVRACLLVGAQIAGGILASFLVKVLFPTKFNVRTTLSKDTSLTQGVFIEAILTAELVFTVRLYFPQFLSENIFRDAESLSTIANEHNFKRF